MMSDEELLEGFNNAFATKEEFKKTIRHRARAEKEIEKDVLRYNIQHIFDAIHLLEFFRHELCPCAFDEDLWIVEEDEDEEELILNDLKELKKLLNDQDWI